MMNKIINFHDVRNTIWFERTLHVLRSRFRFVRISDIEDFYFNGKKLKNTCHLTIDDGDLTFYNFIYPVLKKMQIPATIFVSAKICTNLSNFWFQEIRTFDQYKIRKIISENYKIDLNILKSFPIDTILKNMSISQIWCLIDKYKSVYKSELEGNYNMSIKQLREIDREGLVTIGAHTLNHPILANEPIETSEKEIVDSIKGLENELEHEIRYFAYPNGTPDLDYSIREIEILRKTNCRLAFSTEAKDFTLSDNPLSIPRYGLSRGNKIFIRTKLFLGKYWNTVRSIKSKDEIKLRNKLKKKINFQNISEY